MPLAKFKCPDGISIDIPECLEKCRLSNRCLTRATLQVISRDKVWDGVPHTTALLNGTMLEFLKITKDYTIDPKSRAFALLGSSHHKLLESPMLDKGPSMQLEYDGFVSELPLNIGWLQGTCDLIEREGEGLILTDAKTWGAARLLRNKLSGLDFHPVRTPPDLTEAQLQLNAYRVMIEQQYGWRVDRLQVQCTVRDGGLSATVRRGVKELMYLLPVGKLPDDIVLTYFQTKANALRQAIDTGSPQPCTYGENWGGNRCRSYCEVASFCPEGVKYL